MSETTQKIVIAAEIWAQMQKQGASINTEPVWVPSKAVLTLGAGTYDTVTQTSKFGNFRVVRLNPDHYDIPKGMTASIPVHRKAAVGEGGCTINLFVASRDFQTTNGKMIKKGEQKLFARA